MDNPSLLIVDFKDMEDLLSLLSYGSDLAKELDGGTPTAEMMRELVSRMSKKYSIYV